MPLPAAGLPDLPPLDFSSLSAYLESAAQWIERVLPRYLPGGEPDRFLYGPARDYPLRGGKRFRPALLLLSAALCGADARLALPSAVALELFQNFALVHDDIEDGSWMRRGKPALHRLHGVPLAINAGDLLYSLVFEALQENEALLGAPQAWAVQAEFLRVFRHTFEGQALDIGWIQSDHLPSRAEYETMIRLKTGWYSGRGPCRIGALIAGAPAAAREALGEFGERLGIGFQVRDDVLNLAPDSAQQAPAAQGGGYGKEQGGDFAEGKRTLIVIHMLERLAPAEQARLREILATPPEQTRPEQIAWAIRMAESSGALDAVRAHCRDLAGQARQALRQLPSCPQRALLEEMTGFLIVERGT